MSLSNDSYNEKDPIYKRLSTKGESVEDINRDKTDSLKWHYTDVLYSFRGIYVIGVWAYCNNKHAYDKDAKNYEKIDENSPVADINLDLRITDSGLIKFNTGRQQVSRNYCLDHHKEFKKLNENSELKQFIDIYETVGNLIPVWPGCNQFKGTSDHYDLASKFFIQENVRPWFDYLLDMYKNSEMKFLVEDAEENITEDNIYHFLKTMNPEEYKNWLEKINDRIEERTGKLMKYMGENEIKRISSCNELK